MIMTLVREHNRVAAELENLHPMWDDDKLYLEVITDHQGDFDADCKW